MVLGAEGVEFESTCCCIEPCTSSLSPQYPSSLICMCECLAIDSGGYL